MTVIRWDDDEGWEGEKERGAGSTAAAIGLAPRKPMAGAAAAAVLPRVRRGGVSHGLCITYLGAEEDRASVL